jgi:NitT/TauT family transport system ATP-binding protein
LSDRVLVLSHRPSRIRAMHDIVLDAERDDMMAVRQSPRFFEFVRLIWSQLEVRGSDG